MRLISLTCNLSFTLGGSLTSVDSTLPEIRIHNPQTEPAPEPEPAVVAAAAPEHSAIRRYLLARGNSAVADRVFKVLMLLCALSIFVIVALIAISSLTRHSSTGRNRG